MKRLWRARNRSHLSGCRLLPEAPSWFSSTDWPARGPCGLRQDLVQWSTGPWAQQQRSSRDVTSPPGQESVSQLASWVGVHPAHHDAPHY